MNKEQNEYLFSTSLVASIFLGALAPASLTWILIAILTFMTSSIFFDDPDILELFKFAPEESGKITFITLFVVGIIITAMYHVGMLFGTLL